MTPTALRDLPVSRRCALFGVGGVGAAAVLAACSSGSDGGSSTTSAATDATSAASTPPSTPETTAGSSAAASSAAPGGDAIASLSDIPVGGTATAEVDGETVLLSQPTAGTVEAFSAVCPHQGGQVQPDGGKFKCSLHGSEFDLDGAVTQGPARSDLTAVEVTVSGDSVVKA